MVRSELDLLICGDTAYMYYTRIQEPVSAATRSLRDFCKHYKERKLHYRSDSFSFEKKYGQNIKEAENRSKLTRESFGKPLEVIIEIFENFLSQREQ